MRKSVTHRMDDDQILAMGVLEPILVLLLLAMIATLLHRGNVTRQTPMMAHVRVAGDEPRLIKRQRLGDLASCGLAWP